MSALPVGPSRERVPRPQALHRLFPVLVRWPRLLNLWPQFRLAGIRVRSMSPDRRAIVVQLRQRWWNTNNYGTIFGGSLYALCDPFLVLLVMYHLGPDYRVWDKGADIRFVRPGRRRVQARFAVTGDQIAEIRSRADRDGAAEVRLPGTVLDGGGNVVVDVTKIVYVRRRTPPPPR